MPFPRMLRVRQKFSAQGIASIPATVQAQLASLKLAEKIQPGETVAITAGSRGIANIAVILRETVKHFQSLGARPFLVPAMGSHGGGTVDGQLQVLSSFDITPEFVGAEIRASMDTVVVAETSQGIPVHFDQHAFSADHVFVCNRIKPHTGFVGEIESGLHKMMLIGLGKHVGAKTYHNAIVNFSFKEIIQAVADVVLEKCGVIGGLGIVENAFDETELIEAIAPQNFRSREPELLELAKQWMPKLPFDKADLLIVDEMGKNISGTGIDTNVVGRKFNNNKSMPGDIASILRIFVRGLTKETHGNGSGIGIAEFTTQRCVDQLDMEATRVNCVTANHPMAGAIPVTYPNDREALTAGLSTIGIVQPENAKVMHITNTLHMSELLVSAAFEDEVSARDDLEQLSPPAPMEFNGDWLVPVHPA